MRRFILIIGLLAGLSITGEASAAQRKEKTGKPSRFEMTIGWCGYPVMDEVTFVSRSSMSYGKNPMDYMFSSYDGGTYMTGNIVAEMNLHLTRLITLSFEVAADGIWKDTFDTGTSARIRRTSGCSVTILPQARIHWFNREWCRMYSSAGFGLTAGGFDGRSETSAAGQIVPFGITFGKRFFGFAEVGAGTLYLGGKFGVGYRF